MNISLCRPGLAIQHRSYREKIEYFVRYLGDSDQRTLRQTVAQRSQSAVGMASQRPEKYMMSRLTRRRLVGTLAAGATSSLILSPVRVLAQGLRGTLEGGIDATHEGLNPGSPDDQSLAFAKALQKAGSEGRPLFLAPGRYEVSEIALPDHTSIVGIPGQTRIVLRSGSALLRARGATRLALEGLTFDGAGIPLADPEAGLVDAEDVSSLALDDCEFLESGGAGARLRACAGRVENCIFQSIATVGLLLDQSRGDAGNWQHRSPIAATPASSSRATRKAKTAAIVTQNRVAHIRADAGGTGQNGNGINLDKANGVVIADNRIDDCAFSAIRCFSSDEVAVTGNVATQLRRDGALRRVRLGRARSSPTISSTAATAASR